MLKPLRTLLLLFTILIVSWLMLHFLALFGVFLALAYPLWWFFFPRSTPCILCNSLPASTLCPLCRRKVNKLDVHPRNFSSVLKNSLLIFLLSALSIGLVILETKALYLIGIPPTPKTASFVIPPKGQYQLGEIFPMRIEIIGISTPINAVQTDLSFDPKKLQLVEISTVGSFANIFIQKEINNEQGYARLTGGLPNPGFFADHGLFGTAYFRGLEPGIVTIQYLDSSLVLANDGRGTNILKNLGSISYFITPQEISESAKTQQSALFSTTILGAATAEDQLIFYPQESVLGELTDQTTAAKVTPLNSFLNFLAKVNDSILRFWVKLTTR